MKSKASILNMSKEKNVKKKGKKGSAKKNSIQSAKLFSNNRVNKSSNSLEPDFQRRRPFLGSDMRQIAERDRGSIMKPYSRGELMEPARASDDRLLNLNFMSKYQMMNLGGLTERESEIS